MNEADTRAELIDPRLKAAGWGEVEGSRIQREYPINLGEIKAGGIRAGKLKADYVLSYKNRKLAVIEAKSDELEVGEGVAQAKHYAQKLELETAFATNGKAIYQICLKTGQEGEIDAFPSPDDLWHKTFGDANEWQGKFNEVPIDTVRGLKRAYYYQEIAINRAMEAIADNKNRILLTLATGTGKTFIAAQIAWKLFQSRWNIQKDGKRAPRILFLADRNILADQAYLNFGSFSEDARIRIKPGEIKQYGSVPTNGNVFFTIFQTFMSGPEGTPYFGQYPVDFFDFIIVDECHRGGANDESTWRQILDYFHPAVQLGLTATPRREDNVDTYAYFGEPVYRYSLKEGIRDGFLTPFKVKRIQTSIDDYTYAPDDEIIEGEVVREKVYDEEDFNKVIEIDARERLRVQIMLESINQNEKTLVFCANQPHAAKIRDMINRESASAMVDYCVRVTANDGAIGDMHLRNFQDNDKKIPTILTTSHKLSTGVDARNIRNIVLMRPINSMIEFKQIIGRGTRLYDGKSYFTIIDFVNAYHHFSDPEWDGEPIDIEGEDTGDEGNGGGGSSGGGSGGGEGPPMLRIKLSDGKVRQLWSRSNTYFYVDGKPMDVAEFLKRLFDTVKLPELLGSEEELRRLWANPITRRELLQKLDRVGFHKDDLTKLQELMDAEDSDLFDVLGYIAYAKPPITRMERVEANRTNIYNLLNEKQREFIDFVLGNYIRAGVDELDVSKLSTMLIIQYKGIDEAKQQLGSVEDIQKTFIEFQEHLYRDAATG